MANFSSVGDWSTTSDSNTTVATVNIGENCPMSSLNNSDRSIMAAVKGAMTSVVTTGTDTYTATLSPAPDAYAAEMIYRAKFASANTSTTPTINFNSLGAKTIVRQDGSAVVAGDLNGEHELVYDGTNMRVLNPVKLAANAVANASLAQMAANTIKGNNTSGTANAADLTAPQVGAMFGSGSSIGASGAGVDGIYFGTGTTPLDAYVKAGTWTPADGSGASLTFTLVSAQYTRIGNLVFAYGTVTYPATANGSSAIISGLPLTVANTDYARQGKLTYSSTANAVYVLPNKGAATFNIFTSSGVASTNAQLSGVQIFFELIYPVA